MSTQAQAAIPLAVGARVRISDSEDRFHGQEGRVHGVYSYRQELRVIVRFDDGWQKIYRPEHLEQVKEAAHA